MGSSWVCAGARAVWVGVVVGVVEGVGACANAVWAAVAVGVADAPLGKDPRAI